MDATANANANATSLLTTHGKSSGKFLRQQLLAQQRKICGQEPRPETETKPDSRTKMEFLAAVPYFLFPGATASPSNNNNKSNNKQRNIRSRRSKGGGERGRVREEREGCEERARVEHLIRFLKCPIKIADTFRPYFFGIPYKSRAVIPHAIAASSWAAAVDFATGQSRRRSRSQTQRVGPEVVLVLALGAADCELGARRTLGSVFGFGSEFGTFCNKKVFLFSALALFSSSSQAPSGVALPPSSPPVRVLDGLIMEPAII